MEPIETLLLPHHVITNQIAGLLALAVGPSDNAMTKHTRKMYLSSLQQIDVFAHDPDLDAGMLAASLNISTRYLHTLFATAGTTYGHQLLRIRMERATAMLSDKCFAAMGISEIAALCGFNDPSHFARRFRARFNHTPGMYRTLHLATSSTPVQPH